MCHPKPLSLTGLVVTEIGSKKLSLAPSVNQMPTSGEGENWATVLGTALHCHLLRWSWAQNKLLQRPRLLRFGLLRCIVILKTVSQDTWSPPGMRESARTQGMLCDLAPPPKLSLICECICLQPIAQRKRDEWGLGSRAWGSEDTMRKKTREVERRDPWGR